MIQIPSAHTYDFTAVEIKFLSDDVFRALHDLEPQRHDAAPPIVLKTYVLLQENSEVFIKYQLFF